MNPLLFYIYAVFFVARTYTSLIVMKVTQKRFEKVLTFQLNNYLIVRRIVAYCNFVRFVNYSWCSTIALYELRIANNSPFFL